MIKTENMRKIIHFAAVFGFTLAAFIALPSHAASFDCTKARSVTEHLICDTPELSQDDEGLKELFETARDRATDKAEFRRAATAQWNWREQNCRDVPCLRQWFSDQMARYSSTDAVKTTTAARPSAASGDHLVGPPLKPGSIGYLMLRNTQDLYKQCSNDQMSHSDKGWCYSALAAYADSAAAWNYIANIRHADSGAAAAFDTWRANQKAKCAADNSGGNWSDVNIDACRVDADLAVMGVEHRTVGSGTGRQVAAAATELDAAVARQPARMLISAPQLYADYHANEVAADMKYKGKQLEVKGMVLKIGVDLLGAPYLTLFAGPSELDAVHLSFPKTAMDRLSKLQKGIVITANCVGTGMIIGDPTLNCPDQ